MTDAAPAQGRPRSFAANVMIIGAGAALGQVASVVAAPVIARLFAPEAFGLAAIYGTICAIVAVVGPLRYDFAIPLPANERGGAAVFALSLCASVFTALLAWVVLLVGGPPLLGLIQAEALWPLRHLVPVGILLTSLISPLTLYFQRGGRYATVSVARVLTPIVGSAVVIAAGLLMAPSGPRLVVARTAGQMLVLPALLLGVAVWMPRAVGWVRPTLAELRAAAGRYRDFPLITSWAALLDIFARQAPDLVLAALFGPATVGLFAMARRLVTLPANFLSSAVAQVFFQYAAAAHAEGDTEGFRRAVNDVAKRLATVGVVPVLLIALVGPPLIALVFGERWREAGTFATLLSPVVYAMFVASPMTTLLSVLELHRANVVIQGGMLLTRAGALYAGYTLGGTPSAALLGYAIGVPLALGVQQVWLLRAAGGDVPGFALHLARQLLYAGPVVVVWYACERLLGLDTVLVIAATTLSAIVPLALALRDDPGAVDVLWRILRKLKLGRVERLLRPRLERLLGGRPLSKP